MAAWRTGANCRRWRGEGPPCPFMPSSAQPLILSGMAKLFVILARSEPVGVILRRGPSDWFHLIQWQTRRDAFTHGAWIKGRIYEDRCDLSPDGRLFVYFLLKGNRGGSSLTHAWTAISRPPWLHALALWPQGTTYGGGGRFVDNRSIALRGVVEPPHPDFPCRGLRVVEAPTDCHCSTDDVPDVDWCGRDHGGHIVFTRGGQLFRRTKEGDILVADFTNLKPNPEPAPEWAKRPL